MSDGAFFKVKSSKRSNPESRTTLDAIHNQTVQSLMEQKENIHEYREELQELKKKIDISTSDIEIWRLERDSEALEKKIISIENGSELIDYYLRTGDILYDYYDIQEQIQKGTKIFNSNKSKPGSILAILDEVAQEEGQITIKTEKKGLQRQQLLNTYLQLEDPYMARNTVEEDIWTNCDICGNEMIMCINEANLT